jgi:hypothetical protein
MMWIRMLCTMPSLPWLSEVDVCITICNKAQTKEMTSEGKEGTELLHIS